MSSFKKESSESIMQSAAIIESENDRLRRDIFRPDMEKFKLFTQMLRTNKLYNRAKVTHK